MKARLDLTVKSSPAWVQTVMSDFDAFLQDHADCERKASSMAMSFVAKFPDRVEILPELIDTAIEELEHFKQVYHIMEARGLKLSHEIKKDHYVQALVDFCRSGREERFMDRLLLASVVETRGAERFRLVYEALEAPELKAFYRDLWASEARHGEIFVHMACQYFDNNDVYKRLDDINKFEGQVIESLPLKPALH